MPISDNLTGKATFTLPDGGNYTFYLTVTDPATCISATDRDDDDYTDTDFASFMIAGGTTKILVKPEICKPLEYHFTNGSSPNLTVQDWTVNDLSQAANPVWVQTGGNTFDYIFKNLNVSYQVCLKTTDLGTDCVTITPTANQNKAKFRKDYSSCPQDNFLVQFYNESTASSCSVTFLWDFGDGTTSPAESPAHTYSALNSPYTVKLTMFVQGQPFVTTQQLKIYHWRPDITITEICTDGHIIYETDATDPSWTFPVGTPGTSNKNRIRVCYKQSGAKIVKLFAVNKDDGYCETVRDLHLAENFSRCCKRDKTGYTNEFDYKNNKYRLVTVLRCYGFPHPVVFAKSKLQVKKKNGKWGRKPAHEIRVDLSGNLYTGPPSGCKCSKSHPISGSKKRFQYYARVTKRFMPPLISRTRMRQGDVVATYFVKVDSSDAVRSFSLSLWQKDCGCSGE